MNTQSISIGGRQNVNPKEVIRLQADANYTRVYLSNGKKILVATTLKEIEHRFAECPKFFRISKSMIINIDCIKQISYEKIIFQNGETCKPSRRRKKAFLKFSRPK